VVARQIMHASHLAKSMPPMTRPRERRWQGRSRLCAGTKHD